MNLSRGSDRSASNVSDGDSACSPNHDLFLDSSKVMDMRNIRAQVRKT